MLMKIFSLIIFLVVLINLTACSPYIEWEEEVKLSDGRIIVVKQKKTRLQRHCGGVLADDKAT